MALVLILLVIALPATLDWGRGAGMRTSAANLRSSLGVARRWAVSHNARTRLVCGNDMSANRGYCVVRSLVNSNWARIGNTNYLAKGIGLSTTNQAGYIYFGTNDVGHIGFGTDGSCVAEITNRQTLNIVLVELDRLPDGLKSTITVYRTTGYAKALE